MVRTYNYQRSKAASSISLLDFLTHSFKYHSREQWTEVISQKHWVSIDGTMCTDPNFVLPLRCTVGFDVPEELEPEVDERMDLLFLDQHIAVVSKSGNIPVSESGKYSKRTLVKVAARKFLKEKGGDADVHLMTTITSFIAVHRLDKETSGLVVMARTHDAAVNLGRQFAKCSESDHQQHRDEEQGGGGGATKNSTKNRTRDDDDEGEDEGRRDENQQGISSVTTTGSGSSSVISSGTVSKEYVAILVGELKEPTEVRLRIGNESEWINLLQKKHEQQEQQQQRKLTKFRMMTAPEQMTEFGRDARTLVTPIKSDKNLTLCRIKLFTGRTHQIRIHCASIGFPVLGDKLYVAGGGSVDCDTYMRRAKGNEQVVVKLEVAADEKKNCRNRETERENDDDDDEEEAKNISNERLMWWELHPSRHLLHAAKLTFRHPASNQEMTFESNPFKTFVEACPELANVKLF